ncbi:MAG: RNA 3'-terminal phosphate cyclase [Candidatus Omnitrophica bacterium]|nr:RNA 3'-terminal phosphate cyclase [Candidatus Omnitrophota bacterium]
MIEIAADTLEGGGQILRTALSLSCILHEPVRVFNIRSRRPKPGLKPQHLFILKTLVRLFQAEAAGLMLNSKEITFIPKLRSIEEKELEVDLETSAAAGLFLQTLLLVAAFRADTLTLRIKGGTAGLGAVPVDYYPLVVFPVLKSSGLEAELDVLKRGYYPKGGGEVRVRIKGIKAPKELSLIEQGRLTFIKGISLASERLKERRVAERQAEAARKALAEKYNIIPEISPEYAQTLSPGSEINLYAPTDSGAILWSDARGELKKRAEDVGREAAEKLIGEIDSGAACDMHLADNLIPWMSLLGGRIKTSILSLHAKTNLWVCELFFGKIFSVEGTAVSCAARKGLI